MPIRRPAGNTLRLPGESVSSQLSSEIADLRAERERLKTVKKETAKVLRKKEKQKKRLQEKARLLSNNDLMEVFLLRRDLQRAADAENVEGEAEAANAAPEAEAENVEAETEHAIAED